MTPNPSPQTADEVAAHLYAEMKAPSAARLLYDAVQAATPDARITLVTSAPPSVQRDLAAYAQRRAQLVEEFGTEHAATWQDREEWATWFRRDPSTRVAALKRFYRAGHIGHLIDDWGVTQNPKLANSGGSVLIPFRLWPRQWEMCDWIWRHYRESTPAVCAKAREVGASWIAMAFAASLCVLFKNIIVGVVASVEEKLDSNQDPSPTIPKAREFVANLPPELRSGYDGSVVTAPYLKCIFPDTGSLIRGWTGTTNAGRGARAALVFVDEAAFFQGSHGIDASLSAVTECRIDLSSANGTSNAFYDKVSSGNFDTFYFRIDDDPRRDKAWQERKKLTVDPVIWASEYEISFTASIESALIEWKWVEAAIGLRQFLEERDGFANGVRYRAALDVSDQGRDKNCFVSSLGIELEYLELWSGAGSDQHETCRRAFGLCDEHGPVVDLIYDASSPGAGIAGAARILNEGRRGRGGRPILLSKFIGGGTSFPRPQSFARGTDRKNEDFFANVKAFAYWGLRQRFIESYKARNGEKYDPQYIISISPTLPHLKLLQMNSLKSNGASAITTAS